MLSLSVQEVEMTRKVRGQILQALFSYKEVTVQQLYAIKGFPILCENIFAILDVFFY